MLRKSAIDMANIYDRSQYMIAILLTHNYLVQMVCLCGDMEFTDLYPGCNAVVIGTQSSWISNAIKMRRWHNDRGCRSLGCCKIYGLRVKIEKRFQFYSKINRTREKRIVKKYMYCISSFGVTVKRYCLNTWN